MKKVPLALAIIGFVSVAIGIAIAFVDPLLVHQQTIHTSGRIAYPDEEMKSTESNSETYVDTRGYIPMIIGIGLLSSAFLNRIVKKKQK